MKHSYGLQISEFDWIVSHDPRGSMSRLREVAAAAEESGYRSMWLQDHFIQLPWSLGPTEPLPEAQTTLALLAACTERVQLGVLVCGVTFRNPALLAKEITAIDVFSGGRAILGIGGAWNPVEHAAYGWPFPPTKERLDRLEEAAQLCRLMFTEPSASFRGTHYTLDTAWNVPQPIRPEGIPILIGGGGEKRTLRIVAKHADMSNITATPAETRRKHDLLDQYCAEIGRDPKEIHRTCMYAMRLCDSPADSDATYQSLIADGWASDISLAGSPEVIAAGVAELYDAGIDEVIVNLPRTTNPEAVAAMGNVLAAAQ